jgi:hypothetical protein
MRLLKTVYKLMHNAEDILFMPMCLSVLQHEFHFENNLASF